jgi:enoyl-CoA hydratase
MSKWLKSTNSIMFRIEHRVARIVLNRPEKRNALSLEMLEEFRSALFEADDRTDIHCIVVEGAGRDFCGGYDFGALYSGIDAEAGNPYRVKSASIDNDAWAIERLQSYLSPIFDVHKPVIAKVHGNCLAGGSDLALWCDLVIAATDARIGFPATRANGAPPAHMWFDHVGPQWSKRLLLTGDCLTGSDAAKLGLVVEAVPADKLEEAVSSLTHRLSMIDTDLLSANKRIVNMAMELTGARVMARLAAEMDARAHLSTGESRAKFQQDAKSSGLKVAFKNRDEPFGDGYARVSW